MKVSGNDVGRVTNRVKRQVIASVPPVRKVVETRRALRVRRYEPSLPSIAPEDHQMVRELREEAVHMTTLGALAQEGTAQLQASLDRLVGLLAEEPAVPGTIRPSTEELLRDPRVWQFGLSERMLDVVENYLGMPARYYGADVRREIADGAARDVRQWHRDIEDQNNLKILVWLNDVDADGGPFAYIPIDRSREAARRLRYVAGFVTDDAMRQIVPEDEWRTCPGPKWTAVMADNCQLMHRATPPYSRDRYSVTFTWTTRHPVKTMPQAPMTDEQAARLAAGLSPRQLACLPKTLQRQVRL